MIIAASEAPPGDMDINENSEKPPMLGLQNEPSSNIILDRYAGANS